MYICIYHLTQTRTVTCYKIDREDTPWQTKPQLYWLHPKSGHESWRGLNTKTDRQADRPTDRPSVVKWLWLLPGWEFLLFSLLLLGTYWDITLKDIYTIIRSPIQHTVTSAGFTACNNRRNKQKRLFDAVLCIYGSIAMVLDLLEGSRMITDFGGILPHVQHLL